MTDLKTGWDQPLNKGFVNICGVGGRWGRLETGHMYTILYRSRYTRNEPILGFVEGWYVDIEFDYPVLVFRLGDGTIQHLETPYIMDFRLMP